MKKTKKIKTFICYWVELELEVHSKCVSITLVFDEPFEYPSIVKCIFVALKINEGHTYKIQDVPESDSQRNHPWILCFSYKYLFSDDLEVKMILIKWEIFGIYVVS